MQLTRGRFTKSLAAWIEAELAADHGRAEKELRLLFAALAAPAPTADLVARTMRALRQAERRARAYGKALRWLSAGSLVTAGLALVTAPAVVGPWIASIKVSWIVDWWTTVVVVASQRLAGGLAVWRVLESVAETAAAVVSAPAILMAMAAAVLVSFVSFRVLSELVSFERRAGNA